MENEYNEVDDEEFIEEEKKYLEEDDSESESEPYEVDWFGSTKINKIK